MIRGSAVETTVLERIATNIASSRPDIASSTSRWLMASPGSGAGVAAGRSAARVMRRSLGRARRAVVLAVMRRLLACRCRCHRREVLAQAFEPLRECGDLVLRPPVERVGGRGHHAPVRFVEHACAGPGRLQPRGAAVVGIGLALDVAGRHERRHLPAGHRQVDAQLLGDLAHAHRSAAMDHGERREPLRAQLGQRVARDRALDQPNR